MEPQRAPDRLAPLGPSERRREEVAVPEVEDVPGALAGLLGGVLLTVGGALAWPIFTGGKPIVSLPPFVVVIFEVTVLIGSLTNLVAMSVGSRRGGREDAFPRTARVASGRVGVCAAGGDPSVAERILRERGGEEVGREG